MAKNNYFSWFGVMIVTLSNVGCATILPTPLDNTASIEIPKNSEVESKLDLKLTADKVILTQRLSNNLSHPIYLPPGAVPVAVFRKKDNFELIEIGLQESRPPITWREYIEIPSHSTYSREFILNEIYGFVQGCHDYRLIVNKGYFYPNKDTIHNLGLESKDFTWCNPIDPTNGLYKTHSIQ